MNKTVLLEQILSFLEEIGMTVIEKELDDTCLLPGLDIGPNCLYLDVRKIKYPGDLLHEAGHLAVTCAEKRSLIGTTAMEPSWPDEGNEIAAVLWSYAAVRYLKLPPDVVFHENGYKGESEWIIQQFEKEVYIGLPLLEWMGLSNGPKKALKEKTPAFPHMLKWLR
jgi:hypothetical protein